MSFLSALRDSVIGKQRALPTATAQSGFAASFMASYSGGGADTFNLLEAYNTSPAFRRVISLISGNLAATRWYLVRARDMKRAGKALPLYIRTATSRNTRTKSLAEGEAITEHPFLSFLSLGSPLLAGPAAQKLSYAYWDVKGEYAWLLVPGATDNAPPIGYLPIPPHWLDAYPTGPDSIVKINFRGTKVLVPGSALFWRTDPRLIDPYGRGSGMGEALADELDTDEYAAQLMRTILANKGFHDVIVGINTSDRSAIIDAEARYNANHRGPSQAGRALFLGSDKVSVTNVTQSMSELRLLELREFEIKLCGRVFGIPPEMLGESGDRSRASAVQAAITYATNVLVPRLEGQRLDMQTRLLPLFDSRGEYLLEYEDPTPDDVDARAALMEKKPDAYTLNEWRAIAGHRATEWGEVRTVPYGVIETNGAAPPMLPPAPVAVEQKALVDEVLERSLSVEDPLRLLLGAPAFIRKGVSKADVAKLIQKVQAQELADLLVPEWTKQMQAIAKKELKGLGVEGRFDLVNPHILDDMAAFAGDRCSLVTATTQDALKAQLLAGIGEGEGIDAIRRRVESVFGDLASYRAENIARTETMLSSNRSNLFCWEESGLDLQKQWIATRDARVRASHLALDRKAIKLSASWEFDSRLAPFIAATAKSPGDTNAAAHSCNCRCTHVAYDPQHGKALSYDDGTMLWKAWNESLSDWQSTAINLIQTFARQTEDAVVDALQAFA
jgi:hypothetical protein